MWCRIIRGCRVLDKFAIDIRPGPKEAQREGIMQHVQPGAQVDSAHRIREADQRHQRRARRQGVDQSEQNLLHLIRIFSKSDPCTQ